jgi:hypothetical protein
MRNSISVAVADNNVDLYVGNYVCAPIIDSQIPQGVINDVPPKDCRNYLARLGREAVVFALF